LGKLRRAMVEYPQGWLSTRLESSGQKQADWRTDPKRSGKAGGMGDIGTHAENLLEYMSGLKITKLCADLNTFVEGRQLDDDGAVLLELEGGAKATLLATQIAAGEENSLSCRRRRKFIEHQNLRRKGRIGMATNGTQYTHRKISRQRFYRSIC